MKIAIHFGRAVLLFLCSMAALAQGTSRTCFFAIGIKAEQTQHFPGVFPVALGGTCNDGLGNVGFATQDGLSKPVGEFEVVAGKPRCLDVIKALVPYENNPMIPKSGLATLKFGNPVVFLKPNDLALFSAPVTKFLYAHECGHHALGQVRAAALGVFIGPDKELAADCFAIKSLKKAGTTDSELQAIFNFLLSVPGDQTTYAGPIRVNKLKGC